MSKVIIEGKLCGWQVSDLHVGISIDAPMIEGDWAALSGRRVRVTVEAVEPEPRCPHCGGVLDWSALMSCPMQHEARCRDCSALGWGKTKEAALDALAEWLAPCSRCGGKARIYQTGRQPLMFGVECSNPLCQLRLPSNQINAAAAALWWNEREGQHG